MHVFGSNSTRFGFSRILLPRTSRAARPDSFQHPAGKVRGIRDAFTTATAAVPVSFTGSRPQPSAIPCGVTAECGNADSGQAVSARDLVKRISSRTTLRCALHADTLMTGDSLPGAQRLQRRDQDVLRDARHPKIPPARSPFTRIAMVSQARAIGEAVSRSICFARSMDLPRSRGPANQPTRSPSSPDTTADLPLVRSGCRNSIRRRCIARP